MSGGKLFVDTNICIYLLNGDTNVADLLNNRYVYISIITEIELYAYHSNNEAANKALDEFINDVNIINIDKSIKEHSIKIRKYSKLKVPDTIIAASALALKLPLLSADKAFKRIEDLDLMLYEPFTT
ncbi:type II toxin-antitoxin system VapC family toxin [Mucilaginibacter polytrichastri]|uniref:PIN domain-containing protein n=1 Tax=Mucilaginibacter polytrichastri TaxID=1302689 RepID=A0A1Q6A508_9SPHI|nr:type II toxin-antitoxin system VapC family toxin [Mucilaginibacter polytrichastri]OKS89089.1 hypothetical protein RG47T_4570 [Mucilaginibacter polytrichastri]SFS96354.1 hypothetical protein SAMN04487890_107131 [Mucilaginibacter polytrichastri]